MEYRSCSIYLFDVYATIVCFTFYMWKEYIHVAVANCATPEMWIGVAQ